MLNEKVTKRLAAARRRWHDAGMTDPVPPPSRRAGGALLAAAILGGVVIGSVAGQPSIGFLAGLAIGLAAVALVWAGDRRR